MGQPKKRTSPRRTGMRRSHQLEKLAKRVNARSPIKVYTSRQKTKTESKTAAN
jgi:ribosomal protein L32